jgi:hypothetical protein
MFCCHDARWLVHEPGRMAHCVKSCAFRPPDGLHGKHLVVAFRRIARRVARGTDALFAAKSPVRKVPFEFVLDALAEVGPHTKFFFGCTGVYVDDKIVFVLRDKPAAVADNGVWIATTREHHASLRRVLPSMRSITVFGSGETGWQTLPAEDDGFEEQVMRACELVVAGDPRIGKVPKKKSRRASPAPR